MLWRLIGVCPISVLLRFFFPSASYPTWLFQTSSFLSFFSCYRSYLLVCLGDLLEGLRGKGFPRGICVKEPFLPETLGQVSARAQLRNLLLALPSSLNRSPSVVPKSLFPYPFLISYLCTICVTISLVFWSHRCDRTFASQTNLSSPCPEPSYLWGQVFCRISQLWPW